MSRKLLFFRSAGNSTIGSAHPLPFECRVEFWRPRPAPWSGYVGRKVDLVWWLFHHAHVFRNRDFSICRIWENLQLVHQSVVFPPYFRFPFMGRGDLQIGDTWTLPSQRNRGLAVSAIENIVTACARPGRAFWYVVSEDNVASTKVMEKCTFELVGTGVRTKRFGLRLFGAFQLTEHHSAC